MPKISDKPIATDTNIASDTNLLCAAATPFWWNYLTAWIPSLSGVSTDAIDDRTKLKGTIELMHNHSVIPVQKITLLDTMHSNKEDHIARLAVANMVIVFTQGNKTDALRSFFQYVVQAQSTYQRRIPILICISLADDAQITALGDLCGNLGVDAQIRAVNASDNTGMLAITQHFLRSGQHILAMPNLTHADTTSASASAATSATKTLTAAKPAPAPPNSAPTVATNLSFSASQATIECALQELMKSEGALAAALVDASSSTLLNQQGDSKLIATRNSVITEMVRMKLSLMEKMRLEDHIEDMLITLSSQYHVIRTLSTAPNVFVYLVLNRDTANLALARLKVMAVEQTLTYAK
jgi:hypothetical protein